MLLRNIAVIIIIFSSSSSSFEFLFLNIVFCTYKKATEPLPQNMPARWDHSMENFLYSHLPATLFVIIFSFNIMGKQKNHSLLWSFKKRNFLLTLCRYRLRMERRKRMNNFLCVICIIKPSSNNLCTFSLRKKMYNLFHKILFLHSLPFLLTVLFILLKSN